MKYLTLILPLFLLISCERIITEPINKTDKGVVKLRFDIDQINLKKTIEPNVDMNIQSYDILGTGPDGEIYQESGATTASEYQISLSPGNWTIEVHAKNGDGDVIGSGSIEVEIKPGEVIDATILIYPLEGKGELRIQIEWPADIISSPFIDAALTSRDSVVTPLDFNISTDKLSASFLDSVASGYYSINIKLFDDTTQVWGKIDAIRILASQSTHETYSLVEEINQGGLTLSVNEALQNPVNITLNGVTDQITKGEDIQVNATMEQEVESYQWSLDGQPLQNETNSSITIGSGLPVGAHTLDVIVKKNEILSSAGFSFTVVEQTIESNIIFLHHSTGERIWNGGVSDWFQTYNTNNNTNYQITEQEFPKSSPYGWNNYPYDYWNVWVNNAGVEPYLEEPTLEILSQDYDVIVWKHCFLVSDIMEDTGSPDVTSPEKRIENYQLQYQALKTKMHEFGNVKFVVWTGAARVQGATTEAEALRAEEFFNWVRNTWDEPEDNIFLWDFWSLESEGGIYLKDEYAESSTDSHPNTTFAATVAPLFSQRVVNVIQGIGDSSSLTGE